MPQRGEAVLAALGVHWCGMGQRLAERGCQGCQGRVAGGVYDIILILLVWAEYALKTQGIAYGWLKLIEAFNQQGWPGGTVQEPPVDGNVCHAPGVRQMPQRGSRIHADQSFAFAPPGATGAEAVSTAVVACKVPWVENRMR